MSSFKGSEAAGLSEAVGDGDSGFDVGAGVMAVDGLGARITEEEAEALAEGLAEEDAAGTGSDDELRPELSGADSGKDDADPSWVISDGEIVPLKSPVIILI
ncbi:MAG: hypothetical protein ACYCYM_08805 [Saccharofermentanales bacterium]